MQAPESDCNANGYTKELRRFHGLAESSFQRIAAGILHQKRSPPFEMHQLHCSSRPSAIQSPGERIGVLKSCNRVRHRLLQSGCQHKHLYRISISLTSEQDELPVPRQPLENEACKLGHSVNSQVI